MPSWSQDPGIAPDNAGKAGSETSELALRSTAQGSGDQEAAALGPVAQPVSAEENPAPATLADSPAEAKGRRTLSTAFVRVGPDGLLTVKLRDERVLILRNVVMHRKKYCGLQVLGEQARAEYCGGYAEVAAAQPGGAPASAAPDLAAPHPLPTKRN
jgi:hypothetical protein